MNCLQPKGCYNNGESERLTIVFIDSMIMSAQFWHTDANTILCPTDDPIATLRIVLETEHQLRQYFRIHVRQLIGPDLFYHVTGGSG